MAKDTATELLNALKKNQHLWGPPSTNLFLPILEEALRVAEETSRFHIELPDTVQTIDMESMPQGPHQELRLRRILVHRNSNGRRGAISKFFDRQQQRYLGYSSTLLARDLRDDPGMADYFKTNGHSLLGKLETYTTRDEKGQSVNYRSVQPLIIIPAVEGSHYLAWWEQQHRRLERETGYIFDELPFSPISNPIRRFRRVAEPPETYSQTIKPTRRRITPRPTTPQP